MQTVIHTSISMKLLLGTSSLVPEMSLNIDGKESFHLCWKLLLHYAFISPHWGGREIKLLISNFINSLIYSESHIKQNFSVKYLSIPSRLCARYFSEAQEEEGIRCSVISDRNEWDVLGPACGARPPLENITPCQVLSSFFAAFVATAVDPVWLMALKTCSWEFTEIHASKTLNCLPVREQWRLKQQKARQIVFSEIEIQFRVHLSVRLGICNVGVLLNYQDTNHDFCYILWVVSGLWDALTV